MLLLMLINGQRFCVRAVCVAPLTSESINVITVVLVTTPHALMTCVEVDFFTNSRLVGLREQISILADVAYRSNNHHKSMKTLH
jgi:hypothetical protein